MPSAAIIKRKRDQDMETNAKNAGSCFTLLSKVCMYVCPQPVIFLWSALTMKMLTA
jgi:NAD-dependent dihydropyrimidine dehydrogenase PreA subunit